MPLSLKAGGASRLSAQLAHALIDLDLADPYHWEQSGRSPSGFLNFTLGKWSLEYGGRGLGGMIDTAATFCTEFRNDWGSVTPFDDGFVYLTVQALSYWPLNLGPTVRCLERQDRRLVRSFHDLLVDAVQVYLPVWDWREARDRAFDWNMDMDQDELAERGRFPEKCVPKSVQQKAMELSALRKLVAKVGGPVEFLMEGVLQLWDAVQGVQDGDDRPECMEFVDDELDFPHHALVVVFEQGDEIQGMFDENDELAGQMGYSGRLPAVWYRIDPTSEASVRSAHDRFRHCCRVLGIASRLLALLPSEEQFPRKGKPQSQLIAEWRRRLAQGARVRAEEAAAARPRALVDVLGGIRVHEPIETPIPIEVTV